MQTNYPAIHPKREDCLRHRRQQPSLTFSRRIGLEEVAQGQEHLPSGQWTVEFRPFRLGEFVFASFVLKDRLGTQTLGHPPVGGEEVGDVVDVETDLDGMHLFADLEIDVLQELQVETALPW